jgi:ferredoxin-NADP reductase
MSRFTTQLRRRELVADQTMAFHFERPPGFQFKAVQTLDLTLIDPPETDAERNTRTFSITSAPEDTDLVIATRTRNRRSSGCWLLPHSPRPLTPLGQWDRER